MVHADPEFVPVTAVLPVIGVSCCLRSIAFGDYPPTPHHTVFHKYVDYVTDRVGAIPVLLPAIPEVSSIHSGLAGIIERLDGLLLTGSPSNVGVRKEGFSFTRIQPRGTADHARDLTTLPLILGCLERQVPVLGICRGMQEMNVSLGGDLHEELHAIAGNMDHRSNKQLPYDQRYQPRHALRLVKNSRLEGLARGAGVHAAELRVNSLHAQGVARLGVGMLPQAYAEDGVLEAIAVEDHPFALGVQWHIEWMDRSSPLDSAITAGFRAACMQRLRSRAK